MYENMDDQLEDIDASWLEEFDNLDKEYKDFYTEELSFIKLHCVYINKNNEIAKIVEEKILLKTPGYLSKEEIIGLIKHNVYCNNIKYSLLSILKFNINIDPIYLKTFLKNKNKEKEKEKNIMKLLGNNFLQSVKNIDTIRFDKCISMFHDLNDLLIIFYDKSASEKRHSNHTKKIFITPNTVRKTKRNLFKDIHT
jgi:hypothetical protein